MKSNFLIMMPKSSVIWSLPKFLTSSQGIIPSSHAVPILQGQKHDGPFPTGGPSHMLISPFSPVLHTASPYHPISISLNATSRETPPASLSLDCSNILYQKALFVSFLELITVFYYNVLFTCLSTPLLHCKFHDGRNIICLVNHPAPSVRGVCTE